MNKTTILMMLVLGLGVNNLWAPSNKDNTNTEQSTTRRIDVETGGNMVAGNIGSGKMGNKADDKKTTTKKIGATANVTVPAAALVPTPAALVPTPAA